MRVSDLIKYLPDFHGDDEVVGGPPTIVKPSCTICGAPSSPGCWKDQRPVCKAHYTAFATEDEICFYHRY